MKITILVDNNTLIDKYLYGEPAVSYYVEVDGKKVLFDLGYSEILLSNAAKLHVDLLDIDSIVLSHGHNDHTWGLKHLIAYYSDKKIPAEAIKKTEIVSHPFAFCRKFDQYEEFGIDISLSAVRERLKPILTKEPYWISDKLVFLGEIERNNEFEGRKAIGRTRINDTEYDDFVIDDSALAYKSSKGLVIITGCSHSGICNIIEYAKRICGDNRIIDIIGGLHLLDPDTKQLSSTLEFLKECGIKQIHACHCTDLNSKISLSKVVEVKETGVGLEIEY